MFKNVFMAFPGGLNEDHLKKIELKNGWLYSRWQNGDMDRLYLNDQDFRVFHTWHTKSTGFFNVTCRGLSKYAATRAYKSIRKIYVDIPTGEIVIEAKSGYLDSHVPVSDIVDAIIADLTIKTDE